MALLLATKAFLQPTPTAAMLTDDACLCQTAYDKQQNVWWCSNPLLGLNPVYKKCECCVRGRVLASFPGQFSITCSMERAWERGQESIEWDYFFLSLDSRRLRDYGIDEDSRLFLAVKPTPSRPPAGQPPAEQRTEEQAEEPPAPGSAFITNLRNFLQRHFSAEDVDKIVSTMETVRVRVTTGDHYPCFSCFWLPTAHF